MSIITCTYLCTDAQLESIPVGTEYAVLSTTQSWPEPFTGKNTIVVKNPNEEVLLLKGFIRAPYYYLSGEIIYKDGDPVNWVTKEFVDPCAGIDDTGVLQSAIARRLV